MNIVTSVIKDYNYMLTVSGRERDSVNVGCFKHCYAKLKYECWRFLILNVVKFTNCGKIVPVGLWLRLCNVLSKCKMLSWEFAM